jgi:two-component system sensor histidine kinase YesM
MKRGLSILQKLTLGLLLMFSLIVIIFWFVYSLNIKGIQQELKKNKISEVKIMTTQFTNQFEQVLINTITLSEDQTVRGYPYILANGDVYSKYEAKLNIINKLALASASTSWDNTITLYYPSEREVVSSDASLSFNSYSFPSHLVNRWVIHTEENGPGYYSNLTRSHRGPIYIEARVSLDNLRKLLKLYTSGTPFLYDSQNRIVIHDGTSPLPKKTINQIAPLLKGDQGFLSVDENGTEYLLNYMKSDMLDLYFIDYHPMMQFVAPISHNNIIFACSLVALMLISLLYSMVLRKQVHEPIITLRQAIGRFDRGDFSSRVSDLQSSEFRMLGSSFNRMAQNTQNLIEQVLLSELEVKDARLKQYQAQINPHFLFNCLNFIQSKASVEDYEAVTAMTLHLGSYCRYVHKIEMIDSTVHQELLMVEHYLSIMQIRRKTITFAIDVPKPIMGYILPKMILQPLVENCIQHGTEPSLSPAVIDIRAQEDELSFRITVSDNGVGMMEEQLTAVRKHMEEAIVTESLSGTGIRNVHQRLRLYYGKRSGLAIESRPMKGTCYTITIEKGGLPHATVATCR